MNERGPELSSHNASAPAIFLHTIVKDLDELFSGWKNTSIDLFQSKHNFVTHTEPLLIKFVQYSNV